MNVLISRSVSCFRQAVLVVAILAAGGSGLAELCAQNTALGFPFQFKNPSPTARQNELAVASMFVPRVFALHDADQLFRMVDDQGTPVPCQLKVLSRWDGLRDNLNAPIKWFQIALKVDLPPGGDRYYYLQLGSGPAASLSLTRPPGFLRIDTGAASFDISMTAFTLLDRVEIGGQVVAGPGRIEYMGVSGSAPTVDLHSTVVEEEGGLRIVVKQTGELVGQGLHFTARTTFVAGRSDCKVDFRLENLGHYGEVPGLGPTIDHVWFQSLHLVVPLAGNIDAIASPLGTAPLNGSSLRVTQDWEEPAVSLEHMSGFSFEAWLGGTLLASGNRHHGVIGVSNETAAMAVGVDRFWQNFPKAYSVVGSDVHIELWPDFGSGPLFGGQWSTATTPNIDLVAETEYRFEGGRWKTHTLCFDFKTLEAHAPNELAAMVDRIETPLIGLADPEWYCRHFAFGEAVVAQRNWTSVGFQRFERMCGVLARDDVADPNGVIPPVGLPAFKERGGTWGGQQMYGWAHYGDVAWDDGYCSLHYGLPYTMLLNYMRTGDYSYFDIGRDTAIHRRDHDQFHTTHPASSKRGGQAYEKGHYHGNFRSPTISHTWVGGMLLHYILTGDEASYEASVEAGEFVLRQNIQNWNGLWGARIPGWGLEALTNLYNYLGDTRFLVQAAGIVDAWNFEEAEAGLQGHVPNLGYSSDPHAQSWMHAIVLGALGKYYLNFQDADALITMSRMADWFTNEIVHSRPSGPMTARTGASVWENYNLAGNTSGLSTHHVWSVAHGLSYAAACLNDTAVLDVAGDLWEHMARYQQESLSNPGPFNYTDPSSFSGIAYKMHLYPTAESKVMGNVTMWGQAYMAAKTWFDGNW